MTLKFSPNPIYSIYIFQNLGSNAIRYSREGGIILIDAQEIQNQVEIIVSDNGTGMSEKQSI